MATSSIPSLSETRDFLIAVGKALLPDRNWGTLRAFMVRRVTVLAAAVTQLHSHIKRVQDDVMPDTASDDGPVDRWARINGTGDRKGATGARKSAAGRVVGTVGAPVPVGTQLKHNASGMLFEINAGTTVGAPGYVDADIAALSTGSQTRLLAGETLDFLAAPPNTETTVTLVKDLDEDGFDAEQYGGYRQRMLDTFGKPTAGGNQSDYVKWALQVEGIDAAFAYPNRAGIGTVDVVALHIASGAARIPTAGDLATLLAYLKTKAPATPAGTPGGIRTLTSIADPRDVEIIVTPDGDTSNAFDWTGGPLTITAYDGPTREVTFSANLPASMKAGHRLIAKGVASSQDGRQYVIEALSAANKVILQTAPENDLQNTDLAYSGGPLVDPIRNAVLAHMNGEAVYAGKRGTPTPASALASTVGLEVLADGIGPANPGGVYGTWSGGLLLSVLGKIVIFKAGVRNYAIATPNADYEATDFAFPNDGQIGLVTPGAVIVRGA